jgi:hypothetical protein
MGYRPLRHCALAGRGRLTNYSDVFGLNSRHAHVTSFVIGRIEGFAARKSYESPNFNGSKVDAIERNNGRCRGFLPNCTDKATGAQEDSAARLADIGARLTAVEKILKDIGWHRYL